jgi:hypothetical protein
MDAENKGKNLPQRILLTDGLQMRDFQGVPDRIERRVPAGANLEALDSSMGMGEPEIEAGALHDNLG